MSMSKILEEFEKEITIRNFVTDFTTKEGERRYIPNQTVIVGNRYNEKELIESIKASLSGKRICTITEVIGDYTMEELNRLPKSMELLKAMTRIIYIDEELMKEYVEEVRRGEK